MRILGDLDRNEAHGTNDLSRVARGIPARRRAGDERWASGWVRRTDGFRSTGIRERPAQCIRRWDSAGRPRCAPARRREIRQPRPATESVSKGWSLADDINSRAQLSSRRSNGGLWLALMILVLALVGASGYFYLSLRNNNISLSQVPELLQSITTLGGRMDATEAKLRDLAANWDGYDKPTGRTRS